MENNENMMMPVKKTGKGLKVLVVFLILVILALISYILIDKNVINISFGNKNSNSIQTNTQDTNTNNSQTSDTNETTNNSSNDINNTPQGDFIYENLGGDTSWTGYGKAKIKGYIKTEHVSSEQPVSQDADLVWFYVLESNDNDFDKFLTMYSDTSFAKKDAISLGCLENNKIVYANDSDEKGYQKIEIDGEDAELILKSTKEKPITLSVEKLKLTSGRGVDNICYSHLTYINVIK